MGGTTGITIVEHMQYVRRTVFEERALWRFGGLEQKKQELWELVGLRENKKTAKNKKVAAKSLTRNLESKNKVELIL